MQATLKHAGLFAVGCVFGLGILYISRNEFSALVPLSQVIDGSEHGASLASLACVPQAQTDDIFFVTCGGIY